MANIIPPAPIDMPLTSSNWTDWYEKVRRVINDGTIPHNNLTGLQGGNSTERYHTTLAQQTTLNTAVVNTTGTLVTTTAVTNGAAAAAGTLLNAPVAGNPTKWLRFNDNGTIRFIPAW